MIKMSDSALRRFFGGSPAAVMVRLAFVSLIVGALMSWLDIDPLDLVRWLHAAAIHLYATGFEGLRQIGRYLAMGAVVVLPVWVCLRVFGFGARRPVVQDPLPGGRWRLPGQPGAEIGTGSRD